MSEIRKKTPAPQKKKKKKLTPFLKLVCFGIIAFSVFLLVQVVREVYTTLTLKHQLAQVQEEYQKVKDENSYLTSEREKLEDPDYVANYARDQYLLSKDDEQVFILPEKTEEK